MSQSPSSVNDSDDDSSYLRSWDALARMIRRGRSFSGNERHCCYLNTGGAGTQTTARFADVSSAIGLDLIDDGRGLGVVDWDHDGDLDFWVSNRTSPRVRMLRNDLRGESNFLALRLRGVRCNRDAIGARVQVKLKNSSKRQIKTLRAGEGFLSQSSKWLHFGLGTATDIEYVTVRWPGDASPQRFVEVDINGRYQLTQDDAGAVLLPPRDPPRLTPSDLPPTPATDRARIVLTQRRHLPTLNWIDFEGKTNTIGRGARLISLWASWCAPCLSELEALKTNHAAISQAGLSLIALNVDTVTEEGDPAKAAQIARHLNLPFPVGRASTQTIRELTDIDHQILYRQKPLPIPCSFLIDASGRVAIVYKGPVEVEHLLNDLHLLEASTGDSLRAALPLGGRNITRWFSPDRVRTAQAFLEGGYFEDAKAELNKVLKDNLDEAAIDHLPALRLWADIARRENNIDELLAAARRIAKLDANNADAQFQLATALGTSGSELEADQILKQFEQQDNPAILVRAGQTRMSLGNIDQAISNFQRALEVKPGDAEVRFNLALSYQLDDQVSKAVDLYRGLIEEYPSHYDVKNNLAWLLATKSADPQQHQEAVRLAEAACEASADRQPAYLDTLAVALAKSGQVQRARDIALRGVQVARGRGRHQLAEKFQRRLDTNSFGADVP